MSEQMKSREWASPGFFLSISQSPFFSLNMNENSYLIEVL